MKNSIHLLLIAGFSWMINIAVAQTFTPDATFGTNGVVTDDFFSKDDIAVDLVRQPDGKFVVAGQAIENSHKTFMVSRYNTDGSADSSFGINGMMNAWFMNVNNHTTAIALQNDGKILIAGHFDNNFFDDPVVIRFNADGTPDMNFGIGSFVPFFMSNQFDEFYDVAVQADGKIVAAGRTWINNSYDFLTVRLLSDGSVDSTFGTNGMVITDFASAYDCAYSVMIMPDGKILVSGNTEPGSSYFAAARYLSDGTLDPAFGVSGKCTISSGNRVDVAYGMAVQPDGKIVLAGSHHSNNTNEFMFVRVSPTGIIDNTFGTNGFTYVTSTITTDKLNDVVIQSNGKILACGSGLNDMSVLVRLQLNGSPDATFGTQGVFTGNMGTVNSGLHALIMLPDQSVVTCGYTQPGNNFDYLIAKFLVNIPSGLDDHANNSKFNLFPNPATDRITIDLDEVTSEPAIIRITDISGRIILEQQVNSINSSYTISLPEMQRGIYMVEFQTESHVLTQRIVAGN